MRSQDPIGGLVTTPHFIEKGKPAELGSCKVTDVVAHDDAGVAAVRVEEFFTDDAARALTDYVTNHLVYERDEIGAEKRVNRATRVADTPDAALAHNHLGGPSRLAAAAMEALTGRWLVEQLAAWLCTPLRVLRPSTPYRLDVGDYIGPHDDRGAPEYRLSVACNLTPGWARGDGGETVVGLIERVEEYDHQDYFFPLKRWTFKRDGQAVLPPVFNSALLLVLADDRAHAVEAVQRTARYSVTTLYGDKAEGR
jgi:hypothetical protein